MRVDTPSKQLNAYLPCVCVNMNCYLLQKKLLHTRHLWGFSPMWVPDICGGSHPCKCQTFVGVLTQCECQTFVGVLTHVSTRHVWGSHVSTRHLWSFSHEYPTFVEFLMWVPGICGVSHVSTWHLWSFSCEWHFFGFLPMWIYLTFVGFLTHMSLPDICKVSYPCESTWHLCCFSPMSSHVSLPDICRVSHPYQSTDICVVSHPCEYLTFVLTIPQPHLTWLGTANAPYCHLVWDTCTGQLVLVFYLVVLQTNCSFEFVSAISQMPFFIVLELA